MRRPPARGGADATRRALSSALAVAILGPPLDLPLARVARARAIELSDEQSLVVDAWAVLSRGYVDPAFGGKDWKAVRSTYVKRKYRSMDEARAAVSEMLGLVGDRYTRYVPPGEYKALLARYEPRADAGGVGVTLGAPDRAGRGGVQVVDVAPGSPAAEAGVRAGARLVRVDGAAVSTADDAAAALIGPLAQAVVLELEDAGGAARTVSLRRAPLELGRASARLVRTTGGAEVGEITLRQFAEGVTLPSLRSALGADSPIAAADEIVIDMRANPGGHFPSAVDAARLFLPAGATVVSARGRPAGGADAEYRAETDGAYASDKRPLRLLVGRNTASAAEVFAGALRENGRAKLVGERTFGKGLVQTIAPMSEGGAVVCTVAHYYTPGGVDINGRGVAVDAEAECPLDVPALACIEAARAASGR